jgi:RING-finger-containing E3 ubiquitin ligase
MCSQGQAQPVSHEEGNRKQCADVPVETLGPDKDSYFTTRRKVTSSPSQGTQVERYVYLTNFTLQMEGIYFPVILIHSCHCTWCHNAEDGLYLYLCSRVEDCAEKKSAKKKSCKKKLSESFFCPVCLEGLKFHNPAPEEQVMSTQCGHMFCYSCIVATLNERKECPLCRKKQTVRNIHPLYV